MKLDRGRMPPGCSPLVEALLLHEREILPQVAIVRARALARARDALRAGGGVTIARSSARDFSYRIAFAIAAGFALVASVAAAYQIMRGPVVGRSLASAPSLAKAARAVPSRVGTETTPALVGEPATVRVAPAGGGAVVKAPVADRSGEDLVVDELRLLERAQHSAARGDYAGAVAATNEHEHRFPAGRLCEEREALRIRALIGLGRARDAREVIARFRRDFPHSVLLPRLDDMLASSP